MGSRKCTNCGKWHDTVLENNELGEVLERFDDCMDCIMSTCSFNSITEQITFEALDKSEQPLADQMAKLYNHFVSNNSLKDKNKEERRNL